MNSSTLPNEPNMQAFAQLWHSGRDLAQFGVIPGSPPFDGKIPVSDQSMASVVTTAPVAARPTGWTLKDSGIALVLVLVSVLYLWPFRKAFTFLNPDEGIILQGAMRILRGQIPYRDFFSFYSPGSFYLNALLMKLFGDSALVPRTLLVGYGGLFSLLTFALARRLVSRTAAAMITLPLLVCGLPVAFLVIHNWDSTVAALIALFCAVLFLEKPRLWLSLLIGALAGVSILFNQARGMGLLSGLLLGLLLLRYRMGRKNLELKYFVSIAAGGLAPLLLTIVFFAVQGAFKPMVADLLWPFRHYTAANHLPYGFITMPPDDWTAILHSPAPERAAYFLIFTTIFTLCALPVFVVLVTVLCVLQRRPDLPSTQLSIAILCGAVTLGSLLSVQATRPDFFHVTFISPLFFFLLPWIWEVWSEPFRFLRQIRPLVLVYLLIGFTGYGITLLWGPLSSKVILPTARGTVNILRPNETIPFIEANFPPESQLLIHPYLPLYSFLTRTMTPLSYDYLQSGMHDQQQFQDAVRQLAAANPPALLYQSDFIMVIPNAWPRTPFSASYDPVGEYIARNYKTCRRFDSKTVTSFLFMVRKDLDCSRYRYPKQ
jgi:4-amino-4-deoxy-L-arabinose transferase-like glycosyltransferase